MAERFMSEGGISPDLRFTPPVERGAGSSGQSLLTAEGLATSFRDGSAKTISVAEQAQVVVENGVRYIVDPRTGKKYPSMGGAAIPFVFAPPIGPPVPIETVNIIIDAQTVPTPVPEHPDLKIDWMRTLLQEIEIGELDFEKDPVIARRVNEMYQTIISLTKPNYVNPHIGTPNEHIGERLHKEFFERLSFQKIVGAFGTVEDAKGLKDVVKNISGEQLNLFFRTPEFVYALNYFEMHGEEFANTLGGATPSQAQENFRAAAKAALLANIAAGGTIIGGAPVTLRADDLDWCINRAEKLWRLWGRRATQTTAPLNITTGEYVFEDTTIKKGDDVYKKVLRMKEWALSNLEKNNLRVYWELMDGIGDGELGENDYIEEIISPTVAAKVQAETGVNLLPAVVATPQGDRLDFTAVNWSAIDFTKPWGGSDLEWYLARKIEGPDGARVALTQPNGFLPRPSDKSLVEAASKLGHLKDKQYGVIKKWLGNFAKFVQTDKAKEVGISPMSVGGADSLIVRVGREMGLKDKEIDETGEKVFGKGVWADVKVLLSRTNAGSALFAMIMALFLGVLEQGAQGIKN
ncbi:MAG: hypothetical protein Q7S44_02280 [bacterium]|nr:hypothetical protein [bacterium]